MKPLLFAVLVSMLPLAATPHKMFPHDWDEYAGRYVLSNGQQMVLQRRGLRMYAQITGRPRTQLVAAAANAFVATDGRLRMTLVDEGDDRVSGTVTMLRPGRPPAVTAERVDAVKAGRL